MSPTRPTTRPRGKARCRAAGTRSAHREPLVVDHRPQPGLTRTDPGNRVHVGGVDLATLPGREHPGPRPTASSDTDNFLTVGRQPVGDVLANPGTPLHRPDPVRPPLPLGQDRRVAARSARAGHDLQRLHPRPITSIVAERLCGSIPITTRLDVTDVDPSESSDGRVTTDHRAGGKRCFEPHEPFSGLHWPRQVRSSTQHNQADDEADRSGRACLPIWRRSAGSRRARSHRPRASAVRRASTSQHRIAPAESSAGPKCPSSNEAATAHAKAVRFAITSWTGAMNRRLKTCATAMTTPQANVTERRKTHHDVRVCGLRQAASVHAGIGCGEPTRGRPSPDGVSVRAPWVHR